MGISSGVGAQTYKHTTLWSRLAFQKEIKNWEFKLEFDYRQQNDFTKSLNNPIQKPLMRWVRAYSTYNSGRFSHTLILPNYIKSYRLVGTKEDLNIPNSYEWRYSFFEEYGLPYKKSTTSLRAGYEYRSICSDYISRKAARFRIRLSETIDFTEKSSLNMTFEPIYNISPNKPANTFGQSQLALRFTHVFAGKINFTTGINHAFIKRNTLIEYDLSNAILCNFVIDI